jgi:hypothetical protein
LPEEFKGQLLGLRLYFFYNIDHPQILFAGLKIPMGTTYQFKVPSEWASTENVSWTIEGTKCENDSCGVISSLGLYTAPSKIPSDTCINIIANSQSDPKKTHKQRIMIVTADPPAQTESPK